MEQAVADDGIGGLNRRWYWRIEQTMVLEDWKYYKQIFAFIKLLYGFLLYSYSCFFKVSFSKIVIITQIVIYNYVHSWRSRTFFSRIKLLYYYKVQETSAMNTESKTKIMFLWSGVFKLYIIIVHVV